MTPDKKKLLAMLDYVESATGTTAMEYGEYDDYVQAICKFAREQLGQSLPLRPITPPSRRHLTF